MRPQAVQLRGDPELAQRDPPEDLVGEMRYTTMLCRGLREFCRCVWYKKVIPVTYRKRYGNEHPGHFLELAKLGLNRLLRSYDNCLNVAKFLAHCDGRRTSIFGPRKTGDTGERIRLKLPLDCLSEVRQWKKTGSRRDTGNNKTSTYLA